MHTRPASREHAPGRLAADGRAPPLAVRDLTVRFGGIVALDGVSFAVREGEVVGLIGPNGAGKTTFFNCLSRLHDPDRGGELLLAGRPPLGVPPTRLAR